jgi:hypothetical protein
MKALLIVVFALLARPANGEVLDENHLAQALLKLPDTQLDLAAATQLATTATDLASATSLDPFILLAQAYVESRFDPTSTSRLVEGTRRTGRWTSRRAPRGWSGNLYCGITQTAARSWKACLALREPEAALAAQAAELTTWLKRGRGSLTRALAGYGCGNAGFAHGCKDYPTRIQRWARWLRKQVERAIIKPVS